MSKKKRHKPPAPPDKEWNAEGKPVFTKGNTAASVTKGKPKSRPAISLEMKNWVASIASKVDVEKLAKRMNDDPEFCMVVLDILLKYTTTIAGTDKPEIQPGGTQVGINLISNIPRPPFEIEHNEVKQLEAETIDVPTLPEPEPARELAAAEPIEVVLEDDEENG